jgi:hypothetical protein
MTAVRLTAALLAALVLAPAAQARVDARKLTAPEGVRAFLLQADEPAQDPAKRSFPRTPSFIWQPVPATVRYEFQLSTSDSFRESGIVWSAKDLTAPLVAPPLALPWISGRPYSLYARVRAVTRTGTTPWTDDYGFNMRWRNEGSAKGVPDQLSSYPGLLRWEPVVGATSYQVWLLDAKKVISTTTTVADEREYYTFHHDSTFTGSVRWRVRAVRALYGARANSLPAVSYAPWSGVYTSFNTSPFPSGPFDAVASVADTIIEGTSAEPEGDGDAHALMPGFVFKGEQVVDGATAELYRVYAFTDRDCVNVVFRGAVVGSPAYAPRTSGMLKLPDTLDGIEAARTIYLKDTTRTGVRELTNDGIELTPNEVDTIAADSGGTSDEGEAKTEEASATGGKAGTGTSLPASQTAPMPPVDLHDTKWPEGGYYWTFVPVVPVQTDLLETTLAAAAVAGATTIEVEDAKGLGPASKLEIGLSPPEVVTIKEITGTTVTLEKPLTGPHAAAEQVKLSGDTIHYQDAELPQDACDAGRVMRFGKRSQAVLAKESGEPFASGLSTKGRLVSARSTQGVFSGQPLVAWSPAPDAQAYEVQWSKTEYPFEAAADPILTYATAAVLPLKPGTWYYRVRGLNLAMPKGAQALAWPEEPAKVIVARPQFKVAK